MASNFEASFLQTFNLFLALFVKVPLFLLGSCLALFNFCNGYKMLSKFITQPVPSGSVVQYLKDFCVPLYAVMKQALGPSDKLKFDITHVLLTSILISIAFAHKNFFGPSERDSK
jgi:hypothetical protein